MPQNPFPTLSGAAADCARDALGESQDQFARLECPRQISLDILIKDINSEDELFIGLTNPVKTEKPKGQTRNITDSPQVMLDRRNKGEPILILGDATGPEESSLRGKNVVTRQNILNRYHELGKTWLNEHVKPKPPKDLFDELVRLAGGRGKTVDPVQLSNFTTVVYKEPKQAHVVPQKQLFLLGLIPDKRVIDDPKQRLNLNLKTINLLRSSAESKGDQARFERLSKAQKDGNKTAIAACQFHETRDRNHLKTVELDDLLKILEPSAPPPDPPPGPGPGPDPDPPVRPIDIFELLNQSLPDPKATLTELGEYWDPTSQESVDKEISIEDVLVKLRFSPEETLDLFPEGTLDQNSQVLCTEYDEGETERAEPLHLGNTLLETANLADQQTNKDGKFSLAATEFLEARLALKPLELWVDHALELLLLNTKVYDAASRYVKSWNVLVDQTLRQSSANVLPLRELLPKIDLKLWKSQTTGHENQTSIYDAVTMYPIHPFVISPLLEIVKTAWESQSARQLGKRINWEFDLALPAYPAFRLKGQEFNWNSGKQRPHFKVKEVDLCPEVSVTKGLDNLIHAYVKLHPFTEQHLSTLFISPAQGSGVTKTLEQAKIRPGIDQLSVSEVIAQRTRNPASGLDWEPEEDIHLQREGRKKIQDWVKDTSQRVNIGVMFLEARPGELGAVSEMARPSPGLGQSFEIKTRPMGLDDRDELTPIVISKPRGDNDVVQRMLRLGYEDDKPAAYWEVKPMLKDSEIAEMKALSEICDWIAVAVPGSMGLIPLKDLGDSVTYIGRQDFGPYMLFVYCRDTYAIRKFLQKELDLKPVWADNEVIKKRIVELAEAVPNGIITLALAKNKKTESLGLIVAMNIATHEEESNGS
jgi:hypothetical protein